MALVEGCKHSLEITVPVVEVEKETERVVLEIQKKVKLPGFRGHFPLCGEGSTNGQETSSCLSLGVPG